MCLPVAGGPREGGVPIKGLFAKVSKLAAILQVCAWRKALWHGVAAAVEHTGVLRRLGTVKTVVDIGANRGQFALVCRHCFPNATILSFEPLPIAAAAYRRVFSGDMQTQLVEAAIGPENGSVTIHLSKRDDSSSLLPITERQSALFPGTAEKGRANVRVTKLRSEIEGADLSCPALLKLDVQGFELCALVGCEDLLDRFAWIYVECSFIELYAGQALAGEVVAWLIKRGLSLSGIYNLSFDNDGQAVQADFLFAREAVE